MRSFVLLLAAVLAPAVARGGTVTTTADSGLGSLRQALAAASSGDTIDFDLADGAVITLSTGPLVVAHDVTIAGPGAARLTIDADGSSQVLHVMPTVTATVSGVTVSGGFGSGGGCVWNENAHLTLDHVVVRACTAGYGAGILNDGETAPATMTLRASTITANQTNNASGAGIYNDGAGGDATLDVDGCTIDGNQAPDGGGAGIYNDSYGSGRAVLRVVNSTFSDNGGIENGGGITNGGFLGGHATLVVSNSTFANNSAPAGGAIYNAATSGGIGELQIGNTILQAGNGGTIANDAGNVTSVGFNLASDAVGGDAGSTPGGLLGAPTDRRNLDPLLGPLQANGGPTETRALLAGSPALDAGQRGVIADLTTDVDQRGFPRPYDDPKLLNAGDGSDIGAFEAQAPRDLAVVALKAPKRVPLKQGGPAVSRIVRVVVQNRGLLSQTIASLDAVGRVVALSAQAIGATCAAPLPTLVNGKPNRVPRTIKPKRSVTLAYAVSIGCANDPAADHGHDTSHADFRWTVTLSHTGFDGIPDVHAADDGCPRPPLAGGKDTAIDAKHPIADHGCGAKNGGDVLTDVVVQ